MINYSNEAKISSIKYSIIGFFNKNKTTITFIIFLVVIALLTGVFTGIKLYNMGGSIDIERYSFITLINGDIYSVSIFIKRFLSATLVLSFCILFSINKWLSIFGFLLIAYRLFLVALNCTFIVIVLGFGGTINSLLIIFPCQLLIMFCIIVAFLISKNCFKTKSVCGKLDDSFYKTIMLCLKSFYL